MNFLSAKMIGEHLGLPSIEVNKLLQKAGYLTGKPVDWIPTSMAQGLFELRKNTNGYGGYAKREWSFSVSYTHLRAHETVLDLVCRLLLEKNKKYIIRHLIPSTPADNTI